MLFIQELWSISRFDYDLYAISEIMLSVHNNVDICTRTFCEYPVLVIDLHCPLKTKTIRHYNVSYTNVDLRKLQRNVMRNLKYTNQNPENIQNNAIAYFEINVLNCGCRRKYFEQRCDGGPNNQHFWPTIKSFINNKKYLKKLRVYKFPHIFNLYYQNLGVHIAAKLFC